MFPTNNPENTMKKLTLLFVSILILGLMAGCSSPEDKAAEYIANAQDLLADENLVKAEIEYKNALQINQNLPDAWYGLAKISERRLEWPQVFAALNKVRELAPGHLDGRIMLGELLLSSNQLEEALEDAKEILEMAPDDARSHALMAAVQLRLENFKGALLEIDKALEIDPNLVNAFLIRARLYIDEKRYDEALAELGRAREIDAKNLALYLLKIQVHTETDNKQALENTYHELIEQFPSNTTYKRALVRHHLKYENIDAAERLLQSIAESAEGDVDAKLSFVAFERQYRSLGEAIAQLQTYINADQGEYRYRFFLGELYENSNQADKAQQIYDVIVADDGVNTNGLEARNKIALIEYDRGNRDRTIALVDEVLAQDKSNETATLLRASLQLGDGEVDDAIVNARTVLRDNPDSMQALGLLGQAYEAAGSDELALEAYTQAFQLHPEAPVIVNQLAAKLLRLRKYSQADDVLQQSLQRGNNNIETIKLLAQAKLALGDWDRAEQLAKLLQQTEGQEALSQQMLGVVYLGRDQQQESIEAFKLAHEMAPDAAQPVVSLVRTYVRNGQIDEARRFLQSILSVDDTNFTAHLLLGQLSLSADEYDEATRHFNAAIASDPKQSIGYRNLASALVSNNEPEKAEAVLKKGAAALPDVSSINISLAVLYQNQGEFEKAIAIYQAALEEDDSLIIARNNLASILTDTRSDQASMDLARMTAAKLRDSPIPQFQDTYAWAAVKSGINLEEAIIILEEIVKTNSSVGAYSYHLGEAYRRRGDVDQARESLNRAIALESSDSAIATEAKKALKLLEQ
jgi:tetratricopeptide (TPR) repeat protein